MRVKYPKEAGIYKLTCSISGKIYVGKSVNIKRRLYQHKSSKEDGYFQRAVTKHGWDSFEVEILETVENFNKLEDNIHLLEREAYYINLYESTNRDKGYNRCEFSNDTTGNPVSIETREKMRQKKMGNTINLGKTHSPEAKEKMKDAKLGKPNLSCVGKVCSDETKNKIRLSKLGKKQTEEHKEKIRLSNLGRVVTEETREKIRLSNLGKHSIKRNKHDK